MKQKQRMNKIVSNINKIQLLDILVVSETKEDIPKLDKLLKSYIIEEATKQVREVYNGIIDIINEINEINKEFQMAAIISALDKLRSTPINHLIQEFFPFLNTSKKADYFLVYVWEFFENVKEIIEILYDNRSPKVKAAKKATEEILTTVNDIGTKFYEFRKIKINRSKTWTERQAYQRRV